MADFDGVDHRRLPRRRAVAHPVPGWAARLRARRLAMGWTLADLARKLGVTKQFLSLLELGRRTLFTEADAADAHRRGRRIRPVAHKLAKLLGMDPADLTP